MKAGIKMHRSAGSSATRRRPRRRWWGTRPQGNRGIRQGNRGIRQGGYTVIEVVMSLALLSIGATGVIAMQKATLLGTVNARNLATANAVAATWLERLQLDGLRWRLTNAKQNTIASTTYLQVVGSDFPSVSPQENVWLRPQVQPTMGYSPMADVRGKDTTNSKEAAFCTNIKLSQLLPNLIRAEVRVFWLRHRGGGQNSKYAGTINNKPLCDGSPGYLQAVTSAHDRYHFVSIASAILQLPASN